MFTTAVGFSLFASASFALFVAVAGGDIVGFDIFFAVAIGILGACASGCLFGGRGGFFLAIACHCSTSAEGECKAQGTDGS